MKKVTKKSEGLNYSAIELGNMEALNQYNLVVAPGVEIPGKVFIGGELKTTGSEISFQSFAPNTETGFLHSHKSHEELYIFVSGNGEFQVDEEVFSISEGSVVRVATKGKRSVRNIGDTPLVMICVQYRANSFTEVDAADGEILKEAVKW